jgi:hypothetical protein
MTELAASIKPPAIKPMEVNVVLLVLFDHGGPTVGE